MVYDPKEAVKHIVHDYVYLVAAGMDTQRHAAPLRHPFNHYAERTFYVHCRGMAEFFNSERDLKPKDFLQLPFSPILDTWTKSRSHIQMHLMHIMAGRTKPGIKPWTGEANKPVLDEFRAVWIAFLEALRDDLKPIFEEEFGACQQP